MKETWPTTLTPMHRPVHDCGMTTPHPDLIGAKEAAAILHKTHGHVNRLARDGSIPTVGQLGSGARAFDRATIERIAATWRHGTTPPRKIVTGKRGRAA